ncbi:hypothetical protein TSUD_399640 [Trifolium subterraneum]|uniref:Retrovirus-related Pol polyprotein from transposon TNT 1-94 n=1 Tax=Trifolium subterraneum TaxID=3900 RepID=A0A2Z6P6G8_TRISU|nr:hypothetical protein TSUD_399640 [Trifolium subterraneum]
MENGQYNTWSELFKIHARVFEVLDHIIPPSATAPEVPSLKETNHQLWLRLDAIVLQWIYDTISTDLLNTIIEPDYTAELAWNRLYDIFYDNKNSRALYLEQEFSRTHMEQFSDASSYCQHLKSLSDQLYNVGAPVSNERMVLQLISGLTDAYATVGSQIRHAERLPLFYKARSMLILEETARAKKAANTADNAAFLTSQTDAVSDNSSNHTNRDGGNNNRGRGSNNRGNRGRGRNSGRGGGGNRSQHQQWTSPPHHQQQWTYPPYPNHNQQWSFPPWQPWSTPPCPYPTTGNSNKQGGILGPKPTHQAHVASTAPYQTSHQGSSSYAPTDIQAAMHTFSISPADDQ